MRLSWLTSVVVVVLAIFAGPAAADTGFTNYRQAAVDQYGSPTGGGSSGSTTASSVGASSVGSPSVAGSNLGTAGGHKAKHGRHPFTAQRSPSHHRSGTGSTGAPAAGPSVKGVSHVRPVSVAVPSQALPAQRGTLPFTGDALGVVVLVALALLALGLLLAAALRIVRGTQRAAA